MSYAVTCTLNRWAAGFVLFLFAAMTSAHDIVTVSPKPSVRTDALVGYYFDANGRALFAERMRDADDRKVKPVHDGTAPPPIPQTPDGADTRSFVVGACPASGRSKPLATWETHFSATAKFAAYYKVDYADPKNPLQLLVVEDLGALTPTERQRPVQLLCADEETSHCNALHKCTIPCGSSCCCP